MCGGGVVVDLSVKAAVDVGGGPSAHVKAPAAPPIILSAASNHSQALAATAAPMMRATPW